MNNKSVQYGIIAALVNILSTVISSLFFSNEIIAGKFGVSTILQIISFVALIVFMVKAVKDQKALQSGFIRFKEGLKESFTVGSVWSLLTFIVGLLVQKVILKSTYDRIFDLQQQNQIQKMEEKGMSEETIDASMQMIEKFQDIGVYFGLPVLLVLTFIIALIISAILQKKNPQEFA